MPTVLLVEDDQHVRKLLALHLQRSGFAIEEAGTIAEARAILRDGSWDVAVLDRRLPDGDGLELCVELRTSFPHGYILMLTGESSGEAKLEGFQRGADDYVTKPFQVDELIARVRAGGRIVELQRALLEKNRQLADLSRTDGLTGLRNRRAFDERIRESFTHAVRYGRSLSMAIIDVDFFKAINDSAGHGAGDSVLRCVASRLEACTRSADFVARIGGEEFAMLLPETALFEAMQVGEKVRASIAATPIGNQRVTVSTGIASFPHSFVQTVDELYRAADQALYRAKANGRNRVEIERRRSIRDGGGWAANVAEA